MSDLEKPYRSKTPHTELSKAKQGASRVKRFRANVIFNLATHRKIKSLMAADGRDISDLMEELAYNYLKERGQI